MRGGEGGFYIEAFVWGLINPFKLILKSFPPKSTQIIH